MNEIDKLFSPSYWCKRLPPSKVVEYHLNFIENESKKVRKTIPCYLDINYGYLEREKLDIFGVDLSDDAPIFVFIHGGYWSIKEITRKSYEFFAENLYKNNIKSIFISYELCPDVTLPEIIKNIEIAIKKCIDYAEEKNSKGLYLSGHSAGGHLVAHLFTNFINCLNENQKKIIKASILLAGIYDLCEMQKSTIINEPLQLDELLADHISPQRHLIVNNGNISTVFYIIVGEFDSPEFIKQSKNFHKKLINCTFISHFIIINGVDHYNLLEDLSKKDYELTHLIVSICNGNTI